jgi:hypothetical protein
MTMFLAGTKGSARRMRDATASGVSTFMSDRSMTPSRTSLPPSSESTEQSSLDWAVSIETWRHEQFLNWVRNE